MRRLLEFCFLFLLLACLIVICFTSLSYGWKWSAASVYVAIIVWTLYSLMLENRTSHFTLVWMYVLIFLPFIGYLFYLYSGQLYLKGQLFQTKLKHDRKELQLLAEKGTEPNYEALSETGACFAKSSQQLYMTMYHEHTHTDILVNGEETFTALKEKLLAATSYIHMEYYTFRSDELGRSIIDVLIQKAQEGIDVRFLFDGMGSLTFANRDIKRLKTAGVKVYPFLPIKHGFFNQKFNFRNHRKIAIIDGKYGFTGGLNIGMEYLGANKKLGFWRDTHLLLQGEAVQALHAIFLLDWNYVTNESLMQEHRYTESYSVAGNGSVQVVPSGPDTGQGVMSDLYYSMISCAKQSIWIATPYFVPNEAIRTALRVAARKGIQVRVMVPENSDSFLTKYASRSYVPELLRAGIEIYFYKKGFMHQKVVLIDGELASVGSANMDLRSFHLNFEVNVFLTGHQVVSELHELYKMDIQDCEHISLKDFKERGRWERSKESFARLFSGVL
ncbi:cardiolipin synthetase [Fictibacillus macauensis ZFHKF-1]|uniref:Cardiolipin synthase n=2 Tax=Fictibacillus TaxID=1329200 RepID=I8UG31_9BACL|nr:cardiolipin synthase [Fictibacillus macauensis]EIT85788.1 cardiolipin synthetase [Fictibacillus macauensis ZFHKF-1]